MAVRDGDDLNAQITEDLLDGVDLHDVHIVVHLVHTDGDLVVAFLDGCLVLIGEREGVGERCLLAFGREAVDLVDVQNGGVDQLRRRFCLDRGSRVFRFLLFVLFRAGCQRDQHCQHKEKCC